MIDIPAIKARLSDPREVARLFVIPWRGPDGRAWNEMPQVST